MSLEQKLRKLRKIIAKYNSCVIAFSGGADSTFLLKVVARVLPKDKILAVTADSVLYPKEELLFANKVAKQLGVRQRIIKTHPLRNKKFCNNLLNRCYICKKELFSKIQDIAGKSKLDFVLDASSVSDKKDFRPGSKAAKELKVRSPLIDAGFRKIDIRNASKKMGLGTWNKPSLACLASRIPYGMLISQGLLKRINKGEVYLRNSGFKQVRLRHHGSLCRIEVLKSDIPRLISKRHQLIDKFKKLGYNYVTVDLEGYRLGSLNPVHSKTNS